MKMSLCLASLLKGISLTLQAIACSHQLTMKWILHRSWDDCGIKLSSRSMILQDCYWISTKSVLRRVCVELVHHLKSGGEKKWAKANELGETLSAQRQHRDPFQTRLRKQQKQPDSSRSSNIICEIWDCFIIIISHNPDNNCDLVFNEHTILH